MYKAFYALKDTPFSKENGTAFKGKGFAEASARLAYLQKARGIGVLLGEPGLGKTFVLRSFASALNTSLYKVVYYPLSTGSVMDFYRGLVSLSKMNLKTARAYNIKLSLQKFWEFEDLDVATAYLKKWYFWATHSRIEPIKQAAYFIKRHWDGIIQFVSSRINNGILEGINSLIQATKRKARGYRNVDNLICIIYLTCGKLKLDLPKAFV